MGVYERAGIPVPVEIPVMLKEWVVTSLVHHFTIISLSSARKIASNTIVSSFESATPQSDLELSKFYLLLCLKFLGFWCCFFCVVYLVHLLLCLVMVFHLLF